MNDRAECSLNANSDIGELESFLFFLHYHKNYVLRVFPTSDLMRKLKYQNGVNLEIIFSFNFLTIYECRGLNTSKKKKKFSQFYN